MFDSLPYRNDAAIIFRRLARSLPLRKGVLGIATCDKGLPAMLMAVAGLGDIASVVVPGGVTLPPAVGEDAGAVQTLGMRFSRGLVTLQEAADLGCRACASPGGGCQFLGTAATAQVVGEALGLSLPHSALAPSGQPVWLDMARRSARRVASDGGTIDHHWNCALQRKHHQCDHSARCFWRFYQPVTSYSGNRTCCRFAGAHGGRLDSSQSPCAEIGQCSSKRSGTSSDGASISGWRRSRSDAAFGSTRFA